MLFLLRKIRRTLLSNRKITTYFFYAIGEILLVVAGILIAVQIDDWNGKRIENKEETKILLSLKEDFLQSKINMDSTIENQTKVFARLKKLSKILMEKDRIIDADSIGMYIYDAAYSYWKIEPTNGTYDGLISSGKTGLIKNKELKRQLENFSAEIKFGFEDEAISIDLTTLLVDKSSEYAPIIGNNYVFQNVHYLVNEKRFRKDEINKALDQLMSDDSFRGTLLLKTAMEWNRLLYHQSIYDKLKNILVLIDQELQAKNID